MRMPGLRQGRYWEGQSAIGVISVQWFGRINAAVAVGVSCCAPRDAFGKREGSLLETSIIARDVASVPENVPSQRLRW